MSERSALHSTFVIERTYPTTPARVFRAFADPKAKALWFHGPDEPAPQHHELDFRVGGREVSRGGTKGGPRYVMQGVYQDIVPNERIVFAYDMHMDDKRISVSLQTLEFKPEGRGTRLVLTEQGVFLDGLDKPEWREQGTKALLEAMGRSLSVEPASA